MKYLVSSASIRRALTTATAALAVSSALAQSDNFDDGNDAGWTRYDPISVAISGPPFASFTFPSGAYRIAALPSPNPGALGPARAGSFRTDVSYSDFYMSVDIVSWDFSLDQAIGLFARTRQIGPGTTDGYVFNYNPRESVVGGIVTGQVQINRVIDEASDETIAEFDITLDPTQNNYRFVFSGEGSTLRGQIFTIADPNTAVVQLSATDTMWTSGFSGIFVYDNTSAGDQNAVATFDNYLAAATAPPNQPDPPTLSSIGLVAGELRFGFAAQAGFSYQVQKAITLPAQPQDWTEVQTYPAAPGASVKQVAVPATGGAGYVRVVSPAPTP